MKVACTILLALLLAPLARTGSLPDQRFSEAGSAARPADRARRIRLLSATDEIKSYLKKEFESLGLPGTGAHLNPYHGVIPVIQSELEKLGDIHPIHIRLISC